MAPEKLRQVTFPHHPRRYSNEDADELVSVVPNNPGLLVTAELQYWTAT